MKKLTLSLLAVLVFSSTWAHNPPDEGMWLPMYLKKLNEKKMKELGCNLNADDIFSMNRSSLKDAIVSLGGFCTAEIVSDQGLMLTNHHCAYDAIKSHSSVDNDYLTDGFWAYKKGEELHVEGLVARIVVSMKDVTAEVKKMLEKEGANERSVFKEIADKATEDNDYNARVKAIFDGNQYMLSVYETFKDIRLVGAPPTSIGKYGGDTDNWMWPRHTGDFSMLRIYAGEDNKPADYSASNKPYKPKHVIPISLGGVDENDFVMIMGFPGTTNRYLTSSAIESNLDNFNKPIIDFFGIRTRVMKSEMDKSDELRIMMASDYASKMNTYKYFIGQSRGLKSGGLIEEKVAEEAAFANWAGKNESKKEEYLDPLNAIKTAFTENGALNKKYFYYVFGLFQNPAAQNGRQLNGLEMMLEDKATSDEDIKKSVDGLKEGLDAMFEEYHAATEEKVMAASMFKFFTDMPANERPEILNEILANKKYNKKSSGAEETLRRFAKDVFSRSILTDKNRLKAFLMKPSHKALKKDPGYNYSKKIFPSIISIAQARGGMQATVGKKRKNFVDGMMKMNKEKSFYPDANSTLRLTYGQVLSYEPRDAVWYNYYTTIDGLMEKEDPKSEEFIVPAKLSELYKSKDYSPYAKEGTVRTCFLSNNDITGGNSGSPIMNADGHLVGIAFDGNWESMTGDLMYEDEVQRTINVDIRYVLFVIDKFAGAKNLIAEMQIVKAKPKAAVVEEPTEVVEDTESKD